MLICYTKEVWYPLTMKWFRNKLFGRQAVLTYACHIGTSLWASGFSPINRGLQPNFPNLLPENFHSVTGILGKGFPLLG